jgi:hypothetical protein
VIPASRAAIVLAAHTASAKFFFMEALPGLY